MYVAIHSCDRGEFTVKLERSGDSCWLNIRVGMTDVSIWPSEERPLDAMLEALALPHLDKLAEADILARDAEMERTYGSTPVPPDCPF